MRTYGVLLFLTEKCNASCSYCYQINKRHKDMKIDDAIKIIEKARTSKYFNNSIDFFGGEPTLNMELINKLITTYKDIHFSIITNGTWIYNDKIIKVMKKIDSVNISIEGNDIAFKTIRNRRYPEQVVHAIHENKFKKVTFNISINGLLHENVSEFVDLIHLIESYGYGYHLYTLRSENDYFQDNKDFYKFIMKVKSYDENLYLEIIDVLNHGRLYPQLDIESDPTSSVQFLCGFDNSLTVRYDGTISPCARIQDIKLNDNDIEDPIEFLDTLSTALGHKSQFRCNTCKLKYTWACKLRCPAFHIEMENHPHKMNMLCERELMKYELRQQYWKDNPDKYNEALKLRRK